MPAAHPLHRSVHAALPHTALAAATNRLARIAGVLLLQMAFCAAAADAPDVLYHRFTLDAPGKWVSIELRPTAAAWHTSASGGASARTAEVRSVLGSLKGIAIGARCTGRTEESVHYPCAFDIDTRHHGETGVPLEAWMSTTAYKLVQPGAGLVTAFSTREPEEGSIAVPGEADLLALVAPEALRAQFAQGRPLRLRVRVRAAPVPDDGRGAVKPSATTGPTQGVIVITTQPLRPQSNLPTRYGGRKV